MSVIIKGMEMPKNCYECPFAMEYFSTLFMNRRGKFRANYSCVIAHKVITSTKRNRFCPLVSADVVEVKHCKWIPVTERLPESGEWVLCACRASIFLVMKYDDGDWYENPAHVYMRGFVTHWMPLPEPPKEG